MLLYNAKHSRSEANNLSDKEYSPAERRATRIKRVRNLANLTRKQMCENSTIKPQTLIGWEVARHGGLSKIGARKIIERIALEGVICSFEWLFDGEGQGPTLIPDYGSNKDALNCTSLHDDKKLSEDERIIDELRLFRKHYTDSIELQITDDTMSPRFVIGDYVAGVKLYHEDIAKLVDNICIVQLESGAILTRLLKTGNKEGYYTLICLNYETNKAEPIIYNVKLICAARVIFHRKKLII